VFSNYARANCPADEAQLATICRGAGGEAQDTAPAGGPWWSLMFEVSESALKPVDWQTRVRIGEQTWPKIVLETLQGAVNTQLVRDTDEVVSLYHRRCAAPIGALHFDMRGPLQIGRFAEVMSPRRKPKRAAQRWRPLLCRNPDHGTCERVPFVTTAQILESSDPAPLVGGMPMLYWAGRCDRLAGCLQ